MPILLQISWIFQNIPNFLHLDGFEESYGQITKKIGNQKNVNLSKSWNLTFFQDKISELFFYSCGPRIPKWNCAHHLWSKQAKNIRKTSKNSWFTAPCFRTRQTGHPVGSISELVEFLFHSCGPRIPKWNYAHLAWSKQAKNIRKTSKNSWFTAPCFRTRQTGHPVVSTSAETNIQCEYFLFKVSNTYKPT